MAASKEGWYRAGLSSGRGAADWAWRDCGPGRGVQATRLLQVHYSNDYSHYYSHFYSHHDCHL